MYAIPIIVLVLSSLAPQVQQPPSRADSKAVNRAVQELAYADPSVADAARRELQSASSELVVSEIAGALNKNPAFQDQLVRAVAYTLLRDHRAAQFEVGYQQLLKGLKEPRSVPVLSALQSAPADKQREVITAIGQVLTDRDRTDSELSKALEILARSSVLAQPSLAHITALYEDDQRGDLVRDYAAYAMIRVGGLESALQHFDVTTPEKHAATDLRAVLTGLTTAAHASAGDGADGIYQFFPGASDQTRQTLQSIAVGSLTHKDAQVRKAALEFVWPAFGTELVVEQNQGVAEINPRVLAPIRVMMQRDPDPVLRAEARRLVAEGGFQKIISDFKRARETASSP